MQTVTRHGGGSHYVRPDRIYRTGVIQSAMGYDPNADVDDVVASFTAYPMDLQPVDSGTLAGLGAFGVSSMPLLQRLKLRFNAWKARRAMRGGMKGWHYNDGMNGLRGFGNPYPHDGAREDGVAYPQIGQQIAPAEVNKRDMAALLMNGGMARGLARAQAGQSWNHWINKRWNG